MTHPALRLWTLEQPGDHSSRSSHTGRFMGAVAVLCAGSTYVILLRARHADDTGEHIIQRDSFRMDLASHQPRFDSLDEALAWAERTKDQLVRGGWTDVPSKPTPLTAVMSRLLSS